MPAPTPARTRDVYFVGAGLACAAGLPNTSALLDEVLAAAELKQWLRNENLRERLIKAFAFYYPDAEHEGFRPGVVDFFSAHRTFLDIGAGFRGTGFDDAPDLYRVLKLAIADLLFDRLKQIDDEALKAHEYLDKVVKAGNVIVTSNWDLLIEHTAAVKGVPVRLLGAPEDHSLLVLKLHGSIDWCVASNAKQALHTNSYAMLGERLFPPRPYTMSLQEAIDEVDADLEGPIVRARCLENWNAAWRHLKSRIVDPHMITMVRGKSGDLESLRDAWRHAYGALSRAKSIEIVGYSMPDDDTEIRTLLRSGIRRGRRRAPAITVRNPAPDVHDRVRSLLDRRARSEYMCQSTPCSYAVVFESYEP